MSETSTGLQQNVAGVLCYVLGWVSGIVMLILEPNNKFVRFHAFQSILAFGVLTVVSLIFNWIPFIGLAVSVIVGIIGFIIWVSMMVMASQNKMYKLPYAGDYAEKWAG
ncbi:MAG: hypothetical protein MUO19_08380 [Dehalococcoidales bacterium]|nr:hypothetical protein [Dehalococcoidales bacterium]